MPITVLYLFHSPESKSCGGVQSRASPLFCLGRARKRLVSGIPVQSRKPPPGPPFGRRLRVSPLGASGEASPQKYSRAINLPHTRDHPPQSAKSKKRAVSERPKKRRLFSSAGMGDRIDGQPGFRATGTLATVSSCNRIT